MKRIDCFIPFMNAEQVKIQWQVLRHATWCITSICLPEPTPRAKLKAARKLPSAISTAATL